MSPKNAIKIINIQKSYLVHFFLFGPLWFYLVNLGPIWSIPSTLVLFFALQFYSDHIGPIQSICPLRYYSVDIGPIQSTLVLFGPTWSYSFLFVPIQSIMSTLVLICQFVLIRSNQVLLNPFRSTLVHSILFGLLWSYPVHFGLPCSHSIQFCSILSNLVHFYPLQSNQTTLVYFGPFLCT